MVLTGLEDVLDNFDILGLCYIIIERLLRRNKGHFGEVANLLF